jgi:hypothetical protein
MAKAIVIRKIKFQPANPRSKLKTIEIRKVLRLETVTDLRSEYYGMTKILLRHGNGARYTRESITAIGDAIKEARL